jgi:multidrug efflux pump subunit AcrB
MNSLLRKAISNTPAMNTLMISVLLVGALSLYNLRREVFPEFDLEMLLVTVPYPGASPEEIEEGICQKIEEAVRSVEGIKKQTAIAKEGSGTLVLELEAGVDAQRVLNEVRSEVDRIPSFPLLAEDPEVKQVTLRQPAITVGLVGPESDDPLAELRLRELAEQLRDELIRLPHVSQADIVGAKEFQIDVEISEDTLRRYGLTLQRVADIIRRENFELPGGTIRTEGQDVLVKGENKGTTGEQIAQIPVITQPNGAILTVGDLGLVRDEFTDVTSFTRINGRPGLAISVSRTSTDDLLAMADAVREYVQARKLPPGYELVTWGDQSVVVRDRLDLLAVNGFEGLVLVLVLLALFLDLRQAFWVALGIPVSLLGACAILYFTGQTLNMLTSFTFVMALGIIVDDAIVIGENVYTHRQMGKGPMQAAIDGAAEVLPSVCSSVGTTVVAFVPLLFVTGVMGKFIAVMPLTMIAVLLVSLFEASFILPCHLAHEGQGAAGILPAARRFRERLPAPLRWTLGALIVAGALALTHLLYPFRGLAGLVDRLNRHTTRVLELFSSRVYAPLLRWTLANTATTVSIGVAALLLALGLIRGGMVPFIIFPKLDSNTIEANIAYPDGTPASVTDAATRRLEETIYQVNQKYADAGAPVLRLTRRSVGYVTEEQGPGATLQSDGAHLGSVTAELVDTSIRDSV